MINGHYSDDTKNLVEFVGDSPQQWKHFTSKENVKRFERRVCEACRKNIHEHWKLPFDNVDLRAQKWCRRDGTQFSPGLAVEDC